MLLLLAGLRVAHAYDLWTSECWGMPEIYEDREEMHNTLNVEGTNENYGCIGGSKNDHGWHAHRTLGDDTMMFLETLQLWDDGHYGAIKKICMGFGGDVECFGSANGNAACSWTFLSTDRVDSMKIWRNSEAVVKGDLRLGGIEINMVRNGQIQNFKCGKDHNRTYLVNDIKDKQIAGFFGSTRKDQIGHFGVMSFVPKCKIIAQEIIDVECAGETNGNGACVANFEEYGGDMNVAFMYSVCDACQTTGEGESECVFTFTRSTTNQVTQTSTSIDSIETGAETTITAGLGIEIEGLFNANFETSQSFHINYGHTWEESKSTTQSTSVTIANECKWRAPAGTGVTAEGKCTVGNMMADLIYTIQTTTSCDVEGEEPKIEKYNGEVLVEDVALTTSIQSCKYVDLECDPNKRCVDFADCATCIYDSECKWTDGGCMAATDPSFPGLDCNSCPGTHPYAYRPDDNFDYCCASRDDCNGNAGINAGPMEDRSDCCKDNAHVKCQFPPCEDYDASCPLSHPYAYQPDNNFDYCCSTGDDCNGNEGINSGPMEDRANCCKNHDYVKCKDIPCDDYPQPGGGSRMQEACEVDPVMKGKCDKKCCKGRKEEMKCKWNGDMCSERVPEKCTMDDTAWTGKKYKVDANTAVECYLKCLASDGMPEGKTCRAYTFAPYAKKSCRMYTKNKNTKDSEGKMSGKRNCHPELGKIKVNP